jgi:hypothetical protein
VGSIVVGEAPDAKRSIVVAETMLNWPGLDARDNGNRERIRM